MPIISLLCKHVSKAVEVNPLFIGAPCQYMGTTSEAKLHVSSLTMEGIQTKTLERY